jgi:hypothetical protein
VKASRKESEPARVLGLAANECAPTGVGFNCSALRSRMADRDGKVPGRKPEVTARAVGRFDSCAIRHPLWMMKLPGGSPRLESGWAAIVAGVRGPPSSAFEGSRLAGC